MKKTKKQAERLQIERLLKELQQKALLAKLSPNDAHKFLTVIDNPLHALEVALETHAYYGDRGINVMLNLFDEEIKNTMVGSFIYNKDGPGFLHLRVNPKIPRELIHYLIDRELDSHPTEILHHYMSVRRDTPGLKLKDFLKHHYPNYTEKEIKTAFDPDKKGNTSKRFRSEQTEALRVWEEWVASELSAKKDFPRIAKKFKTSLSTVKTRWYKAYSMLYGETYDPQKIKEQGQDKADRLCACCSDPKCYEVSRLKEWIPCHKYLSFSGKGYQREKSMTKKQMAYFHMGKENGESLED